MTDSLPLLRSFSDQEIDALKSTALGRKVIREFAALETCNNDLLGALEAAHIDALALRRLWPDHPHLDAIVFNLDLGFTKAKGGRRD